jgi:uncharacterized membrane protein YeaQ/YmgE (transglycosylase-associated protein family)
LSKGASRRDAHENDSAPPVRLLQGYPHMTITLTGLLILLLIAGVCGAIGRAIAGGTGGGALVSIAVGFVGALLGTVLAHYLKLPEFFVVVIDGQPFPILWSIIGASLFVALVHLLSGGASRGYRWRYR